MKTPFSLRRTEKVCDGNPSSSVRTMDITEPLSRKKLRQIAPGVEAEWRSGGRSERRLRKRLRQEERERRRIERLFGRVIQRLKPKPKPAPVAEPARQERGLWNRIKALVRGHRKT